MTKEELINNLRYTEKKHRNDIVNTFDTDISMMCSDVLKVLENCIEITDEMTNGDIIKALFSSVEIHQSGGYTSCLFQPSVMLEDTKSDWWNEPYKKGGEE